MKLYRVPFLPQEPGGSKHDYPVGPRLPTMKVLLQVCYRRKLGGQGPGYG